MSFSYPQKISLHLPKWRTQPILFLIRFSSFPRAQTILSESFYTFSGSFCVIFPFRKRIIVGSRLFYFLTLQCPELQFVNIYGFSYSLFAKRLVSYTYSGTDCFNWSLSYCFVSVSHQQRLLKNYLNFFVSLLLQWRLLFNETYETFNIYDALHAHRRDWKLL